MLQQIGLLQFTFTSSVRNLFPRLGWWRWLCTCLNLVAFESVIAILHHTVAPVSPFTRTKMCFTWKWRLAHKGRYTVVDQFYSWIGTHCSTNATFYVYCSRIARRLEGFVCARYSNMECANLITFECFATWLSFSAISQRFCCGCEAVGN